MLDVNLTGHFLCCQAVIPHMLEAGCGRIINMASIASYVGRPNRAGYVAAKGGLLSFTARSLAADMAGKNVTVNALAPGLIASAMNLKFTEDQDLREAWNAENLTGRWGRARGLSPGAAAFPRLRRCRVHYRRDDHRRRRIDRGAGAKRRVMKRRTRSNQDISWQRYWYSPRAGWPRRRSI